MADLRHVEIGRVALRHLYLHCIRELVVGMVPRAAIGSDGAVDRIGPDGWNGLAAVNQLGDLARRHRPDLILMDIQLPDVSGLAVTKWLKDDPDLRSIPVVAVTAFAMKGDEERIRQGGCEAYLSKPISVAKFIDTVRQYVGVAEVHS